MSIELIDTHTPLLLHYILTVPVIKPNIVINAPHAPYIVPYNDREEKG